MKKLLADLLEVLNLEQLEVNLFRGESRDIGSPQVFGGQVLGQALRAASATVEQRIVHSMHAYFLRRGDCNAPIVYEVDRARDGHYFSTRRVVAIQHGEQIFNMSASFQVAEPGFSHQFPMPKVPPPEDLEDIDAHMRALKVPLPEKMARILAIRRPFEFRPVEMPDYVHPKPEPPYKQVWFRAIDKLPDDQALHRWLLAYVSDYNLMDCALLPHATTYGSGIITASIDHARWFHRPVRMDEWLLYDVDSPSAEGARGLARGNVYSRSGALVASTCQEGLMRFPEGVAPPE
jgi:acyl-CoA thioesterase II